MSPSSSYVCIVVVDWQAAGAAIEKISIAEGRSAHSGAWFIAGGESDVIAQIVSDCSLIEIGDKRDESIRFGKSVTPIAVADFLRFASDECSVALSEYHQYKNEEPVKREDLVEPNFTIWPSSLDLEQAAQELNGLKRAPFIRGTDPEMERVLTASRLVKWMVDGWLHDEQERVQRRYMSYSRVGIRSLPNPWLKP